MPLTVRTNGSGSSNQISAAWFNDYHDLLTGIMQDQNVTIKNTMVLSAIGAAPSSAPTAAAASGTGMGIGLYQYVVTFTSQDGESAISPAASVTTTSGNQRASLTAIPTGPTGTTGRNLYRTKVGGGNAYFRAAQFSDNTTTTYTDSLADASLGPAAPLGPTFGGALIIKDSTGATQTTLYSNGSMALPGTLFLTSLASGVVPSKTSGGGSSSNFGQLTRIAFGFAPVTTGGTTITHNLGVVPAVCFATVSNVGTTVVAQVDSTTLTSTTMKVSTSVNASVWWLAMA